MTALSWTLCAQLEGAKLKVSYAYAPSSTARTTSNPKGTLQASAPIFEEYELSFLADPRVIFGDPLLAYRRAESPAAEDGRALNVKAEEISLFRGAHFITFVRYYSTRQCTHEVIINRYKMGQLVMLNDTVPVLELKAILAKGGYVCPWLSSIG